MIAWPQSSRDRSFVATEDDGGNAAAAAADDDDANGTDARAMARARRTRFTKSTASSSSETSSSSSFAVEGIDIRSAFASFGGANANVMRFDDHSFIHSFIH